MEDEGHYMGDNDDWILRLAKVVAIKAYELGPDADPKWLIICEGGYSLDTCDRELAERVWSFLNVANTSDEQFFNRGRNG